MKINYRWMAGVVMALVLGYVVGKLGFGSASISTGPRPDDSEVGKQQSGVREAKPSHARGRRSVVNRGQSRQKSLDRILGDFYSGYYEFDDPFGATDSRINKDHPAWARLCAWVMSASHNDFPASMDIAKISEDGEMNEDVERLLIQRWVELDPDAALSWVESRDSLEQKQSVLEKSMYLIQEAVYYHPEWAVDSLKKLNQQISAYNSSFDPEEIDDPFGDTGISKDYDYFFWRLASLPEPQRSNIQRSLGGEILEFGFEGWSKGMMVHGGKEDLSRLYRVALESGQEYAFGSAFRRIVTLDWKGAKNFVEENQVHRVDDEIWKRWAKEDKRKADEWYLGRAQDADERNGRIAALAEDIPDLDHRMVWIDRMEKQGEPVSEAIEGLVHSLRNSGQRIEALKLVSRLPVEKQRQERERIYDSVLSKNTLWHSGDETYHYLLPNEGLEQLAKGDSQLREYVRSTNERARQEFERMLEVIDARLNP